MQDINEKISRLRAKANQAASNELAYIYYRRALDLCATHRKALPGYDTAGRCLALLDHVDPDVLQLPPRMERHQVQQLQSKL